MIKGFYFLLLSCLFLQPIFAEEKAPQTAPHAAPTPTVPPEPPPFPFPEETMPPAAESHFLSQFLNMLLMLGLLVALLLFCSWFLKRMLHTRIQQANVNSAIKILEQRAISSRTTVYALDIEGKTYVLAETPSTLLNLTPIPEEKST